MDTSAIEPSELSLSDLRALRAQLQHDEDAISYVRRLVQARIDMVQAEKHRRATHDGHTETQDLPAVLGQHLTGGPARPPRPTKDASDHPLAIELDEISARLGANHLDELNGDELDVLSSTLEEFEHARSHERRELFTQLDALSAELVRRYRDGEASVDGLLAEE